MSEWKHRLEITQGDITEEDCDIIVNAANEDLQRGGGVCGAIHRAAGPGLENECLAIGGCPTGEVVMTDAHELHCRKVIHAVGPIYGGGAGQEEADLLASCYLNSLDLCAAEGWRSIAFPSISTGTYGYPVAEASRIAVEAIREGLLENPGIELVRMVCFSAADLEIYEEALRETE